MFYANDRLNTPTLSVLIPTYNYARFLPEAIESVLAQDCPDFELLIADDCSGDNTAEVVRPYCARDSRVQFVAHPANLGMVNNWNYCLEQARGEYIKFLFADDKLCHPQALSKLVALLQKNPSATLAASARVVLNEKSEPVDLWRTLADGYHDGREIITVYLMENGRNLVGEPSAVLFRKRDAGRGFNPQYRQVVDMEMWFHLLEKGGLAYTGEPLCAFRCHPGQESGRNEASGIGAREHWFFYDCAAQPWVPRKAVFPLLFHLRRHLRRERRRKGAGSIAPELLERERRLIGRGGQRWRWFCFLYYIRYRVTKPIRNFRHALERRLFCRRWHRWPATEQTDSRV
jgi:glycosyltransferase involved in cell wall biosynthesis